MDEDGKFHLHRIRVIGGNRFHADDGLTFRNGFDRPVDAGFTHGRDRDTALLVSGGFEALAIQFQ